jgi:hypothetical protein
MGLNAKADDWQCVCVGQVGGAVGIRRQVIIHTTNELRV